MDQECEIAWTESGTASFEEIVAYIARHNPSAAEKTAQRILNRIRLLKTSPFLGSSYESDPNGRIRVTSCEKYRIFYRVQEDLHRVEILRVWHSARQEPDLSDS